MIYLDMDGVIADFFGGLEEKFGVDHWKSLSWKEEVFAKLKGTDFFARLPVFGEQDRRSESIAVHNLVKVIAEDNGIDWGICSSPLRGDEYNSAYHKRNWLQEWDFMPNNIDNCIFTSNKPKYAWSYKDLLPNVLIDDKPQNIKAWKDAGGIGIRFQANEDDIDYLEWELLEAMKERYE
tara:strand:- start:2168 stop:2704 length:537 start_codon:yes stop_codon:yes gene_type:complete